MAADARRILVAPDSFKGTMSAPQVAAAIQRGLARSGRRADLAPVSDGGEGTARILAEIVAGTIVAARVRGPLGRPVDAEFVLLDAGRTAALDVAAASGLTLVTEDKRDAEAATSTGTGELMLRAVELGVRHLIVAAGGSASTDGGRGAIDAIRRGGGLKGARVTVLCDVRTPFERAAIVFGPQKGADAGAVARLTERLVSMGLPTDVPMSGAAGGLAGGLWRCCGATLVAGASFLLDAIDFDRRLNPCAAVIVGEGRLDATSLQGKILAEVATRARQRGVPVHAIVGKCAITRFDARILDLQTIREAGDAIAIARAATEIAMGIGVRTSCSPRAHA